MSIVIDLFEKISEFIPTFQTVTELEGAVFLRKGRHKTKFFALHKVNREMRSLKPGMYLCWPWIDQIVTIPRKDQVLDLRSQSLLTEDGVDVIVSGAIAYRVRTPHLAILNAEDVDRNLSRIALGVITQFINTKTLEQLRNLEALRCEIREGIKEASGKWGLDIWKVMITDIGNTINLRLLSNTEDSSLLEEE